MKKNIKYFSFLLSTLLLFLSCSERNPQNPFDPNSNYQTTPMQGELTITQLTDSQVKLEWQLNSTIVGNYKIERKVNSGNYSLHASVNANTSDYIDDSLSTENIYYYKVFGVNDEIITEPISDSIQTTFSEITDFNVQQENIFTAHLTWSHNCNYEEGYIIERMEMGKGEREKRGKGERKKGIGEREKTDDFIEIADLPANETSFFDDTIIPTLSYDYRIKAYSNINQTNYTLASFINTFPAPTNLQYEKLTISSIQLTWDDNSNGEEGFKIDKKVGTNAWQNEFSSVPENIEEWIDESAEINEILQYRVYAFIGNNNSSLIETGEIDNTIPAPTNLIITQDNVHTFSLIWNDNSNGEQGFNIERKIDNGDYILIHTNAENDTTYTDDINTREQFETVYYKIYAFYDDIYSDYLIGSCSINFPAPTNLQYEKQTISSIRLSWNDNSNGEEGFKIDKKVGTNAWQNEYTVVVENIEQWTDENAEINEILQYRVYAFIGNNNSSLIETGEIDNTIPAPENLNYTIENFSDSTADVHLYWDYTSSGIDGFKVKKNGTLLTEVIPSGTTEWIDVGINFTESISYQVLAFYQFYNSYYSNEVTWEIPSGMIFVQGSTFQMGDHFNEGSIDELPVHWVILDYFYIGEFEVTHTEYIEFLNDFGVNSNGSYNGTELIDMDDFFCAIDHDGSSFYFVGSAYANNADCPVIQVTWYGSVVYCNWKSQQEGLTECYNLIDWSCDFSVNGYRLPTEAEWEYSARGGLHCTDDYRYSGCHNESELLDYAWYYSNSSSQTHQVGTKLPNQIEIHDMSGNVYEWCNDWYSSDSINPPSYYQSCYNQGTVSNPTGPVIGNYRVLRGGGWGNGCYYCRVAIRDHLYPGDSSCDYGFRIVRPVE